MTTAAGVLGSRTTARELAERGSATSGRVFSRRASSSRDRLSGACRFSLNSHGTVFPVFSIDASLATPFFDAAANGLRREALLTTAGQHVSKSAAGDTGRACGQT
jgi:hypothetical protein